MHGDRLGVARSRLDMERSALRPKIVRNLGRGERLSGGTTVLCIATNCTSTCLHGTHPPTLGLTDVWHPPVRGRADIAARPRRCQLYRPTRCGNNGNNCRTLRNTSATDISLPIEAVEPVYFR
ncbi:hypothetical protein J6590_005193 [Homalodisca vitripennis]|nr:hypothetical protein J6590_005193 [Homalodisca vitripennis]